ncbi:MAG: hypothetical protein DRI95_05390 [Bacteroidetes bacterium]|nr:MAG: hypothetical protein DRI95_05390 [Bacteroidota bacterium]RLD78991.1 MAG: hypothetical protein DRJ07_12410 [Bacteroidota bacterium]
MELILRIDDGINQILLQPEGFQKVFMDFRKISTKQFPYCIYYYVDSNNKKIDIAAVMHTSRNPSLWKKRLKK